MEKEEYVNSFEGKTYIERFKRLQNILIDFQDNDIDMFEVAEKIDDLYIETERDVTKHKLSKQW